MEIAVSNPENALEKQKAFFDDLRVAVKAGDMQRVADMLDIKQASPENLTQAHHRGSSPADQIQGIMDQAGGSISAYGKELKQTVESAGKELYRGLTTGKSESKSENTFITNPSEAVGKGENKSGKIGLSEKEAEERDKEIYRVFLGE